MSLHNVHLAGCVDFHTKTIPKMVKYCKLVLSQDLHLHLDDDKDRFLKAKLEGDGLQVNIETSILPKNVVIAKNWGTTLTVNHDFFRKYPLHISQQELEFIAQCKGVEEFQMDPSQLVPEILMLVRGQVRATFQGI